jgi:hypothetical protein
MLTEIFHNILIGLSIILASFLIHAYCLDRLMALVNRFMGVFSNGASKEHHLHRATILFLIALGIIFIHSLEIWLWAMVYLVLDIHAVGNFETALYFSTVSFSTVGYGDVVLDPSWRLLGAMQAAAGMILFGWSTAFIFEVISFVYKRPTHHHHKSNDEDMNRKA